MIKMKEYKYMIINFDETYVKTEINRKKKKGEFLTWWYKVDIVVTNLLSLNTEYVSDSKISVYQSSIILL